MFPCVSGQRFRVNTEHEVWLVRGYDTLLWTLTEITWVAAFYWSMDRPFTLCSDDIWYNTKPFTPFGIFLFRVQSSFLCPLWDGLFLDVLQSCTSKELGDDIYGTQRTCQTKIQIELNDTLSEKHQPPLTFFLLFNIPIIFFLLKAKVSSLP